MSRTVSPSQSLRKTLPVEKARKTVKAGKRRASRVASEAGVTRGSARKAQLKLFEEIIPTPTAAIRNVKEKGERKEKRKDDGKVPRPRPVAHPVDEAPAPSEPPAPAPASDARRRET